MALKLDESKTDGRQDGAGYNPSASDFDDIVRSSLGDVSESSHHEPDGRDSMRSELAKAHNSSSKSTADVLNGLERDASSSRNSSKPDIGKQERAGWKSPVQEQAKASAGNAGEKIRKKVIGWIVAIIIGGSTLTLGNVLSGPAHFLQIANWLNDTYQTVREVQSAARQVRNLASMARVAAKPAVNGYISGSRRAARIGVYGDFVALMYEASIGKKGVSFLSTDTGTFQGYTVDIKETVGLKNKSTKEIAKILGVDESQITWRDSSSGVFDVDMTSTSYYDSRAGPGQKTVFDNLVQSAGAKSRIDIFNWIGSRNSLRANGAYSTLLHPFTKLDDTFNIGTLLDWVNMKRGTGKSVKAADAADDSTKTQEEIDAENQANQDTADKVNDSISEVTGSESGSGNSQSWQSRINNSKIGQAANSRAAGIIGIIIAAICILNAVEQANSAFTQEIVQQAIQTAALYQGIRSAIETGTSNEFTGGDNEDMLSNLGELSQYMLYTDNISNVELDDQGNAIEGTETTSFVGAEISETYQREEYGRTVSNNTRDAGLDNISGNDMLGPLRTVMNSIQGIVGTICGPVGTILGFALDAFSGLGSIIFGQLVGFALDAMMERVISVINGDPLTSMEDSNAAQNLTTAAFGTRLWSGAQSVLDGGAALSSTEAAKVKLIRNEVLAYRDSQTPILAKLFDGTNYNSVISKIAREANLNTTDYSPTTLLSNVAGLVAAVPGWLGSGASNLLGGSTTYALATTDEEYYGFPDVAFTDSEMEKLVSQDDYDWEINTDKVFTLLDSDLEKYNEYTETCMGKTISRIGTAGSEDVDYKVSNTQLTVKDENNNSVKVTATPQYYLTGSDYNNDCANMRASDENFLRVAVYAGIDYNTTQAAACYYAMGNTDPDMPEMVKESCADYFDGAGSTASTASSSSVGAGSSSVVSAATGSLDQLECQDCVAFVKSVYLKAGLPQPFAGSSLSTIAPAASCGDGSSVIGRTSVGDYAYCTGFSEFSGVENAVPGDIAVWNGHVAIYLGDGKVSEGGGGDRSGSASNCNINGLPWYGSFDNAVFLHYDGS